MSLLRRTLLLAILVHLTLTHPLDGRAIQPVDPLPTPERQIQNLAGPPDSQIFPCTATLNTRRCQPASTYAYAATKTIKQEVDCEGCLAVEVRTLPGRNCPTPTAGQQVVDETVTEWEAVCSPTPTLPLVQAGDDPYPGYEPYPGEDLGVREDLRPRQQDPAPTCLTTLILPEEGTGVTVTVFNEFVTVTSSVPCGGCSLTVSTRVGGVGPLIRPGITATEETGTATVYECYD
ncbi:uncharacterized protein DNG_04151 [Cephalotrichum gorgonifer]|uniref:Uncharacterized protein n=1 Tax=Cephalotrichum gorgonifer TaxID=2041049 RepID=A0AAE8MXK3_9PEZI|nr:uncharacterized protein DNG_04151 [Cephalotrichum gorgonifer]